MIDRDTGEILTPRTVYLRSDEIAVTLNPSKSGRKGKRFVKLFNSREAKRTLRKLNAQESRFILIGSLYVNQSSIIVGDGEIGIAGLPLTFEQLRQLLGMSKGTLLNAIRSLKAAGLLEFDHGYRIKSTIVLNGVLRE